MTEIRQQSTLRLRHAVISITLAPNSRFLRVPSSLCYLGFERERADAA